MKRQRGRGRKGGSGGGNRAMESSGPDVKVRGAPNTIYEKYVQLARDAQSSGDRVKAENYLQHAEHYFRIMRAQEEQKQQRQDNRGDQQQKSSGKDQGRDDSQNQPKSEQPQAKGQDGKGGGEGGQDNKPRRSRSRKPASEGSGNPLEVVTPEEGDLGSSSDSAPKRRSRSRKSEDSGGGEGNKKEAANA